MAVRMAVHLALDLKNPTEAWSSEVVGAILAELATLATRTQTAVVFTRHLKRGTTKLLGCTAFEGEVDRITLIEFDPTPEYKHLDPIICPRIVRDHPKKVRMGERIEPLVWLTKADGLKWRSPGANYHQTVTARADEIFDSLFPDDLYAEVPGSVIKKKMEKAHVSPRMMERRRTANGIAYERDGVINGRRESIYVRKCFSRRG